MLPEPQGERQAVASVPASARNVSVPFRAPHADLGIYDTEIASPVHGADRIGIPVPGPIKADGGLAAEAMTRAETAGPVAGSDRCGSRRRRRGRSPPLSPSTAPIGAIRPAASHTVTAVNALPCPPWLTRAQPPGPGRRIAASTAARRSGTGDRPVSFPQASRDTVRSRSTQ
jgi:hypothetical protein